MNKITMKMQVDHLIMDGIKRRYYKRGCYHKCGHAEAVTGEVDLICKRRWSIAGLQVFSREFSNC